METDFPSSVTVRATEMEVKGQGTTASDAQSLAGLIMRVAISQASLFCKTLIWPLSFAFVPRSLTSLCGHGY